jgi:hypothetical protein
VKYGLLGIGGSGSRCLEAFAYTHALGIGGAGSVTVAVIDEDAYNKAASRSLEQFARIQALSRLLLDEGEAAAGLPFRAGANLSNGNKPIVDETGRQKNLASNLAYRYVDADSQLLIDSLYSKGEREFPLADGYRGCAHVGSLDLRRFLEGSNSPLREFRSALKPDTNDGSRVAVVGSLFGGTGQSGLPIIPACLEDNEGWQRTGAVLLTPYFRIPSKKAEEDIGPDFNRFKFATRTAIEHYADTSPYDHLYLMGRGELGDDDWTNDSYEQGGNDQDNDPHEVELAAAVCLANFFGASAIDGKSKGIHRRLTERHEGWEGLPVAQALQLRERYTQLFTAAILHCYFLEPLMDAKKGKGYRWFDRISAAFPGKALIDVPERTKLSEFFREFLTWADTIRARSLFRPIGVGGTERRRKRRVPADKTIGPATELAKSEALLRLDVLNDRSQGGSFARLMGDVDQVTLTEQFNSPLTYYLAVIWRAAEAFCKREHRAMTSLRPAVVGKGGKP